MIKEEGAIRYLSFLVNNYYSIVKTIVGVKNRFHSEHPDKSKEEVGEMLETHRLLKGEQEMKGGTLIRNTGLDTAKSMVYTKLHNHLKTWPIYTDWLEKIPNIGPSSCGHLILWYYYKFVPICKKCGTDLEKRIFNEKKGTKKFFCTHCDKFVTNEEKVKYRIHFRNWPNISSWWSYLGRAPVESHLPEREKGKQLNIRLEGKMITHQIAGKFKSSKVEDHPYKLLFEEKYNWRLNNKPGTTDIHTKNMALNEMVKIFLAHFWMVAREIEELPIVLPYIINKDPGHNIIQPFYWKDNK
jgi:hypothetical protein